MAYTPSAYDRGDSDAYYGRKFQPHLWLDAMGIRSTETLTDAQRKEYARGYTENPSGQKDY